MEITDNLTLIQQLSGSIKEVNVAGGMVKSDLFCQIQADCYHKQVVRYQNNEATSLGAVIVAAKALGVYSSFEQAYNAMATEKNATFTPDEAVCRIYQKLMAAKQRLYFTLANNGVYEEFMDIHQPDAAVTQTS